MTISSARRPWRPRALPVMLVGLAVAFTVVAAGVGAPPAAAGAQGADGYSLTLVADKLRQAHTLRTAPDGRLFVLEQVGRVRVVENGTLLNTPALTLDPDTLVEPGGSAGLLSIAFPPNFLTSSPQRVYLSYTHEPTKNTPYRHNVVSRFNIEGNVIDPASERVIVRLDSLVGADGVFKTMHYGGDMEFGADGKLYVTTGDLLIGRNSQSLTNRLGKVLRYNRDGSIPTDNPFYSTTTGPNRAIWSYGLRNPFKLTFDAPTGRLIIADVGASAWEEVNVLGPRDAGVNFGWSVTEGYTTDPRFRSPTLAYPHADDGSDLWGCAVIGGDTYRPTNETFGSSYRGKYFFAEHCEGWLRSLDPVTGALGPIIATGLERPVDIAVTPNGSVWVLQRDRDGVANGTLFRLRPEADAQVAPSITTQPRNVTTSIGGNATFEVFASGTQPLRYQWRRDGSRISGATSPTYTLTGAQASDDGAVFKVVVSNTFGRVASRGATLTVADNRAPVPTILTPLPGSTFAAGDTLAISGRATDAEDGSLPASAFVWRVILHHNTHTHTLVGPVRGVQSLDVELPVDIETDPDIFYRVHLKVADSDGASTTVTRDVLPRTMTFRLYTRPWGAVVDIDSQPRVTPVTQLSVVGAQHSFRAGAQTRNGVPLAFDSWDGGRTKPGRTWLAPESDTVYHAFFRVDAGSIGTGSGLQARYFADADFTDLVVQRRDRVPFFLWGGRSPVAGLPADGWSARWRGRLQPQFTEPYTFRFDPSADDALRLVLGGQVLIDTFANPTDDVVSAKVPLTAGTRVPIRIDFRDGSGQASLNLQWHGGSTPLSAIPGSQLYRPR